MIKAAKVTRAADVLLDFNIFQAGLKKIMMDISPTAVVMINFTL